MLRSAVLLSGVLIMLTASAQNQNNTPLMVTNGALSVTFDKEHGCVSAITVGKKKIVANNTAAPLAGVLLESATYDQFRDFVGDAKFIEGKYEAESLDETKDGD